MSLSAVALFLVVVSTWRALRLPYISWSYLLSAPLYLYYVQKGLEARDTDQVVLNMMYFILAVVAYYKWKKEN